MSRERSCTFTVKSRFKFPADMLRYDRCWPVDAESVSAIERSHDPEERLTKGEFYSVTLFGPDLPLGPTDKRWSSFLWHVTEVDGMPATTYFMREPA